MFTMLVKDLQLFDRKYFFKNFRMDPRTFDDLLSWIALIIQKPFLQRSNATHVEGLCVNWLYLVTGDSQTTNGTSYGISLRKTPPPRVLSRKISRDF